MARQVYGRMVDGCRDKSLIYESLKAGEPWSLIRQTALRTNYMCIF